MSLQGKKNVYVCEKCAGQTVTIDKDAGVTPFMIACRATEGCKSMMQSGFYRVPQDLNPTHEWYKPNDAETETLGDATKAHVKQGGLLLRPIEGATTNTTTKTPQEVAAEMIESSQPVEQRNMRGRLTKKHLRAMETPLDRKIRIETRRDPSGLPHVYERDWFRNKYIPSGPRRNVPVGNR